MQVWREMGLPAVPVTFWAAEKNNAKRALLIQRARGQMPQMQVDQIFGEVKDLQKRHSYDFLHECMTAPLDADIWFVGFPCVDLSGLNAKEIKFGEECHGQSSSVLQDTMDAISLRKPRAVILENVARILHRRKCQDFKPGHEWVMSRMESMGYTGAFAILDAVHWLPQRRSRAWFVFLQPNCGSPEKVLSLAQRCQPAVVPSIFSFQFMSNLEKFHSDGQSRRHTMRTEKKLKWPTETLKFIRTHGLKPGKLAACKERLMLSSDFKSLSLREQHLLIARYAYLQQCEAIDPFSTCIILDVSQSVGRVPWALEKSPCLTGSSKLWISKPGVILPSEAYAELQGVPEVLDTQIPSKMLRNLIGNAFCGPVAQSVLLSTLAVLSECDAV
eukprot:Skav206024  [mRNA]  locus=scaffold1314:24942:26623:+ [translate_table: standard]